MVVDSHFRLESFISFRMCGLEIFFAWYSREIKCFVNRFGLLIWWCVHLGDGFYLDDPCRIPKWRNCSFFWLVYKFTPVPAVKIVNKSLEGPTTPHFPQKRNISKIIEILHSRLFGTPQPRTLYFLVEAKSRVREVYAQTCHHFSKQGMLDTELFGLAVLIGE
jgi:hypothetical protein